MNKTTLNQLKSMLRAYKFETINSVIEMHNPQLNRFYYIYWYTRYIYRYIHIGASFKMIVELQNIL